jgi:hypothetical protein
LRSNEQDKEEKKERVVDEAADQAGTCCLLGAISVGAILLLPAVLLIR